MMQEIHASIRLELDEDPRQASGMLADFAAAWAEMLKKLDLESIEQSVTIGEARRQRAPRKARTPRLVTPTEAA
jgi:hypothetical protein